MIIRWEFERTYINPGNHQPTPIMTSCIVDDYGWEFHTKFPGCSNIHIQYRDDWLRWRAYFSDGLKAPTSILYPILYIGDYWEKAPLQNNPALWSERIQTTIATWEPQRVGKWWEMSETLYLVIYPMYPPKKCLGCPGATLKLEVFEHQISPCVGTERWKP